MSNGARTNGQLYKDCQHAVAHCNPNKLLQAEAWVALRVPLAKVV
jgi:hypothetical protein